MIGIIASHTDDFLHVGNPKVDKLVKDKVRERFLAGKFEESQFKYVEFNILQQDDGILLGQTEYMEGLKDIMIAPARASKKSEKLTPKELSVLRELVGRMNWAVQRKRLNLAFEMVKLSTKFRSGVVGNLLHTTEGVNKLKQGESNIMFPNLGETAEWKLIVFSDAALANLCDNISSTGAELVLLTCVNRRCHPLSSQANKIK